MELTMLQEALIEALKVLGVSIEAAFPIMMYLETEAQQIEMAKYLRANLENGLSEEEIIAKTSQILNSTL